MIKLIDLSFFAANEFNDALQVITYQKPAFGYIDFIKTRLHIQVIKHAARQDKLMVDDVRYSFFKSKNRFWYIPFATLRFIKTEKPSIVLVQGLRFPLQVIMLRIMLGRQCIIMAQHHAERPFKGLRKICQQLADKCINAYLFTAPENALEWFDNNIITRREKYNELLELSTYFTKVDKQYARQATGMQGNHNFLWVGRLEANKDPITVLRGFELYAASQPGAKLYMAYQQDDMITQVKATIAASAVLGSAVHLLGKIERDSLPLWYSAADFYLSGSHREGSGTALIEAMACGCIPVVTNIPAFSKITGAGRNGFLYEAGNAANLGEALEKATGVNTDNFSAEVTGYFKSHLSFKSIADTLYNTCEKLTASKEAV